MRPDSAPSGSQSTIRRPSVETTRSLCSGPLPDGRRHPKMSPDAVVITGVGVLSPIGCGRAAFWERLANGASGIVPLTLFDTAGLHSRLAGEVNYDPAQLLGAKGL